MTAFVIEWVTNFVYLLKFESIRVYYLIAHIYILRFTTEG